MDASAPALTIALEVQKVGICCFWTFLRITDSASWVITVLSGIIHNTSILLIIASSATATSFPDAIFFGYELKVVFFLQEDGFCNEFFRLYRVVNNA